MAAACALAMFSGNIIFIFAIQKSLRTFLDCLFTRKAMVETAAIEMPLHVPTPSVKNAFVVPRRARQTQNKKE